jgi:fibronectin type 3 domain-containing protein
VYRRKASAARTQPNATIADRERISVAPVTGTSCVDDQVADDGQYYYVITAINAKGVASSPTKEAPAAIPNKDLATAPAVSAPLCRGASAMN